MPENIFKRNIQLIVWIYFAVLLFSSAIFVHSIFFRGLTWDENAHFLGTLAQLNFGRQWLAGVQPLRFETIPSDWSFYGIGTTAPAYVISYFYDVYWQGTKHEYQNSFSTLIHIFSFISYVFAAHFTGRLVKLTAGSIYAAYVSSIAILLIPTFAGYAVFNYKDMPIAAGLIATVYFSAKYWDSRNIPTLTAFFVALLFLGSSKLAALPLAIPACTAVAIATLRQGSWRWAAWLGAQSIIFLALLLVITPPAWVEPWRFVTTNLEYMSQHGWAGCTLTLGECIGRGPKENPNLYSPLRFIGLWYLVQMPIGFLIAILAAAALYLHRQARFPSHLLAASIAWPLVAITWNQSTLYDGTRHTLFLIPLLVAFVFVTIPSIFWERARWALVAYGLFLASEIVVLHPYGYVWFNEAARFIASNQNFETDYWGFSLAESATMAQQLRQPGDYVVGRPSHLVAPYFSDPMFVAEIAAVPPGTTYLLVSFTRQNFRPPDNCTIVSAVERSEPFSRLTMQLSFVARCVKS